MVWRLTDKLTSTQERMEWVIGKASTTYVKDALYKVVAPTNGASGFPVVLSGQTDQPFYLAQSMDPQPYNGQSLGNVNGSNLSPLRPATDMVTTTIGEKIGFIPIAANLVLDTDVVPLENRVAALSNTNKAQAIFAYGGSTGDFTGGVVYLPDQDWQGVIVTSAVGAGNVTLVFEPPAPRACTVNDVVSAVPFGLGSAPKFDSSNPQLTISSAVADRTGGNVLVRKVQGQYGSPKGALFTVSCQMKTPI